MNSSAFDRNQFLLDLIADIDTVAETAKQDLRQLNNIAKSLRYQFDAGNLSELHYTIDRERLNRTMIKCKSLLLTLSQSRATAIKLLEEQ